jgi:hypothetical protein
VSSASSVYPEWSYICIIDCPSWEYYKYDQNTTSTIRILQSWAQLGSGGIRCTYDLYDTTEYKLFDLGYEYNSKAIRVKTHRDHTVV